MTYHCCSLKCYSVFHMMLLWPAKTELCHAKSSQVGGFTLSKTTWKRKRGKCRIVRVIRWVWTNNTVEKSMEILCAIHNGSTCESRFPWIQKIPKRRAKALATYCSAPGWSTWRRTSQDVTIVATGPAGPGNSFRAGCQMAGSQKKALNPNKPH